MSEKYLTDPELRAEIAKFHKVPNWGWETDEQRAIATAASDKGYAVGAAERDALRAEVEVLRRALLLLAYPRGNWDDGSEPGVNCDAPKHWWDKHCTHDGECAKCLATWAISEARKGE